MKEQAQTISNVIVTLQGLDIKPTYENMDRLLGCLQALLKVKEERSKEPEEEKKDGTADAE